MKIFMENVDIYNIRREKKRIVKERNNLENGEYRISAHIWIINEDNKLLIQKRTKETKKFPNMWSQTAGGVLAGESSLEAVKRETKEEISLNLIDENISYIGSYTRKKDIVDIWLVKTSINVNKLILQPEEVAEVKLVTFEEFENMIESGVVVPSINPSYMLVKNYINNYDKESLK